MTALLADEDVPKPVIEKLRSRGVDVAAVDEEMKEATDQDVFATAQEHGRILLTFDQDYRSLAQDTDSHAGVLLITERTRYNHIVAAIYDNYLQEMEPTEFEDTVLHVTPTLP